MELQAFKTTLLMMVLTIMSMSGVSCERMDQAGEVPASVSLPPSLTAQATTQEGQTIRLKPQQAAELPIVTTVIKPDRFSYTLTVPATVFPAPDQIYMLSASINGRVAALYAHEGEVVKRGQPLLELESLEFANLVAAYLQARAEMTYQQSQHDRLKVLVEKKISPQRTLEKIEADLIRATTSTRAAQARLQAVGVNDTQLDRLLNGQENQARLKIYAPIDGVISEHLIDRGQAVSAYQHMATLINLREVLIRGYVSPDDAGLISIGDALTISLKDYPNRRVEGQITTINPSLDPINKSITVNAILRTREQWPMPGINVRMNIDIHTPEPVITVPLSSLVYEGDQALVFIKVDDQTYRKHPVTTHRITSEDAIVDTGLNGGEEIAVSQIFTLKALGKMDEIAE